MRRVSIKRKAQKIMKKIHNQAVDRIAERPEILGIEGLFSETLVSEPIKFPQLRKKGKETGDLILIWSPAPQEWEILVLEITVGAKRHLEKYWSRLNRTFNFLRSNWQDWFQKIGLSLPENYSLWIRTAAVGYVGRALWERPFLQEKRSKIN